MTTETTPEAIEALTLAAKDGRGFEHVTQRLRDAREDAAALATAATPARTRVSSGARNVLALAGRSSRA